jgi:hypothetical protein
MASNDSQDKESRPEALKVCPEMIPIDLRALACWLVWKYVEERDPETGEVDWDKPPLDARGGAGSSTNKKTWSTFDVALAAYLTGEFDGLGFALSVKAGEEGEVLIGVDLDHCRNVETGEIAPWAQEIIDRLNSYTEVSPSGEGVRIFLRGRLPKDGRKRGDFECYCTGRYVTVTGNHVGGTPRTIEGREAEMLVVHRQIWPERHEPRTRAPAREVGPTDLGDLQLVEKAKRMKNGAGARFAALWSGDTGAYSSCSEADLALCDYLAFWCGPNSHNRIDALFRQSGLFRSKWNREDYRQRTIEKALGGRSDFYEPRRRRPSQNGFHKHEGNGSAGGDEPPEAKPGVGRKRPMVLANYRVETQTTDDGKEVKVRVGLSHAQIAEDLLCLTAGWPKRVEGRLFVEEGDKLLWIDSADSLFAWTARQLPGDGDNAIQWVQGADKVSHGEFAAYLRQTVECFESVETMPHEPRMPSCYYCHPEPKGGDGKALARLLDRFEPATLIDHDLIHALFLSLIWGGPPGQRPAWLIESEDDDGKGGRGVGKSKLAQAAAKLVGGHIDARPNEDIDKLMTRLLSPAAMDRRVAFLDNVKTLRFSWADLEAIITGDIISGRCLYVGEGRRPNTLTWIITLNQASLSRDMAQRTIPIRLKRPEHDPCWEADTWSLIETERWAIIGDILAELRRPVAKLLRFSRWSAWEQSVLAHVAEPTDCQKVIEERQESIDDDKAEADHVRAAFWDELSRRRHDPDRETIWISSTEAARILGIATGEQMPTRRATTYLRTLGIPELRKSDYKGTRGWAWRGKRAQPDATLGDMNGGSFGPMRAYP